MDRSELHANTMTRFAFLTAEFVTEPLVGGGLASYLDRITRSLVALGVQVEVLVVSREEGPRVLDHQGVMVRRVNPRHWFWSRAMRVSPAYLKHPLTSPWGRFLGARALAAAFAARHREAPFDAVQWPNSGATGAFVRPTPGCRRLARLSTHTPLWLATDGLIDKPGTRISIALERRSVRRADIVYAPSRTIADLCAREWEMNVTVLRPPVFVEVTAHGESPVAAPPRYLIHYGQLNTRKGTMAIARALPMVWREIPEFCMVWAGAMREDAVQRAMEQWGDKRAQVVHPGRIGKGALYDLIRGSVAAVLPSVADNLPNTVIEALALGKGVIGFRGASVDELVADGVSGELVPMHDVETLARAMMRAWRGESAWTAGPVPQPAIFDEMEPGHAARQLLALAGLQP